VSAGWLTRNWFILGLATAAGLGFLLPEIGGSGGPLRTEVTTRVGVAIMFFLQGLGLATSALRTGALRWRLHLATQLYIFVGFPAAMILLDALGGRLLPEALRFGFLYLAILPTTVSACVVFTSAANGNVAGAVFNSALANTAGVVITPAWAALLLSARGQGPPLASTITEIALLLLAPLALGQLVRPLLRTKPPRWLITNIANFIILFIVFAAFANSARSGAFGDAGLTATLMVVVIAVAIFILATGAAVFTGRRLGFDEGDRIALLFCGPQKTLAAGAPMAQILFAGNPALGLILLPLMAYHATQLFGAASIVERLGSRTAARTANTES
jgi:solute carrier family 10 (sodium/bile acid cotransporter), member 7